MSVTGLLTFAAVYALAVASPGPGIAMIIARGLARGMVNGVPFVLGFVLGDLVWYLVAANGLALLAHHYQFAFVLVRYGSCLYLLYLSFKIFTAPVETLQGNDKSGEGALGAFLSSFLLTIGNPKPIVFFLSIMPLVVDLKTITYGEVVEVGLIVVLVIWPIVHGTLYAASAARQLFSSLEAVKRLNQITASVMALAAVVIAIKG